VLDHPANAVTMAQGNRGRRHAQFHALQPRPDLDKIRKSPEFVKFMGELEPRWQQYAQKFR
ncbi:MAG TPA: hypothetical protein VGQ11_01210, partial [Candidatus Acidoferrales bacterium]|nr:hypothetical protein [Candidatus Acidoferrales bacterium]